MKLETTMYPLERVQQLIDSESKLLEAKLRDTQLTEKQATTLKAQGNVLKKLLEVIDKYNEQYLSEFNEMQVKLNADDAILCLGGKITKDGKYII